MKKLLIFVFCIILLLPVYGCGGNRTPFPDLPETSMELEFFPIINEENGKTYNAIIYQGRLYLEYGTLNEILTAEDIQDCVGFIKSDNINDNGNKIVDKDNSLIRVYTLTGDDDNNFFLVIFEGNFMLEPKFYRAFETKEDNIEIPKCIKPPEDDIWTKETDLRI